MGGAIGRFCGRFEDRHTDSPEGSEDERESADEDNKYKPKDYNKIADAKHKLKIGKRLKATALGGDSATRFWVTSQRQVELEERGTQGSITRNVDGIFVKDKKLAPEVLKKLKNFANMHTIELVNCGLKEEPPHLIEIEALRHLRLSRNEIKVLRRDLLKIQNKCSVLQRLFIDSNCIEMIEVGSLSRDPVHNLTVLNLASNRLAVLPIDFLFGASNLEILDLSYNVLESIPDSILTCRRLRVLDACNNHISKLPEHISELRSLRKFLVNSNNLTSLPESIGLCRHLEKVWLSDNNIRYLPFSMIDLWKGEGGMLEEICVDDNPLVAPSVTAFQMGGADQMFKLFKEFVLEERRRQAQAEAKKALMEKARKEMELRDDEMKTDLRELADVDADEGRALVPKTGDEPGLISQEPETGGFNDAGIEPIDDLLAPVDENKLTLDADFKYYFGSYEETPDTISTIRSKESAMLLLKRQMYVDGIKARAKKIRDEAGSEKAHTVPQRIKRYADDSYGLTSFKGRVHITDIDLFFCLFVVSVKPLMTSCEQLYKKFSDNYDKMRRKDWEVLCARVPVTLSEEVKVVMWKILSHGKQGSIDNVEIDQTDFIAGLHIHDIANEDPFILRITEVLKLRYYEMDMIDFEEKIRRRNMDIASPLETVDFPSDDDDDYGPQTPHDVASENVVKSPREDDGTIEEMEGDRRGMHRQFLTPGPSQTAQAAKKKKPAISMTEVQYCQLRNDEAEDESGADNNFELSSSELSGEDITESSFDADEDYFEVLEQLQKEQAKKKNAGSGKKEKLKVKSEADLEKLMLMPRSELLPQADVGPEKETEQTVRAQKRKEEKAKLAAKKTTKQSTSIVRDPRFATNMLPVRRALREAYRNLPFTDFIAFINFLLRGLKRIKHVNSARDLTYWHSDDPVVSHLMGELHVNPYPSDVLRSMGFVQLFDTYWVWPDKHLRFEGVNIHRLVPPHCPGLEKMRLDDLIKLVTQCRKNLEEYGKTFKGHITSSKK